MKEVIRYQCEFCKKDFKTPDKHKCKFDPRLKNCFSCKHFISWQRGQVWEWRIAPNYPDCAKNEDVWDIESIKEVNYNMQCTEWEKREGVVKHD